MSLHSRKTASALITSAQSLSRVANEKKAVNTSLAGGAVKEALEGVAHPKSIAGGMKKAGMALMLLPDPITDVPAAALLASSYFLKKKEPSSVKSLVSEARKILRDVESLSI